MYFPTLYSLVELLKDKEEPQIPQIFWKLFFIYIYLFFKIIFIYYLY